MTQDEFDGFMELSPTIVCLPSVNGPAFAYAMPVPSGAEVATLHVLYFAPTLWKKRDDRLTDVVAHEVAHLVLGHAGIDVAAGHRGRPRSSGGEGGIRVRGGR